MKARLLLAITFVLAPTMIFADPNYDLVLSARDGNLEGVKKALAAGAEIDAPGKLEDYKGISAFNKNALLWASAMGHLAVARFLVDQGANIEAKDDYTYTPLVIATFRGHRPVVEFLLSRKANPHVKVFGNNILFYAVRYPEIMSILLTHSKFDLEELSEYCTTPFMQAVVESKNLKGILPILIRHGSDPSYQAPASCYSRTAIHTAVGNNDVAAVKVLLELHVRLDQKDHDGLTPLELAKKEGNPQIIQLLESATSSTSPNRN